MYVCGEKLSKNSFQTKDIWKETPLKKQNNQRNTIEEMQKIAKERGGECLSKIYINSHTALEWRCKEGHVWNATPTSVKNNGTWCRKCRYQENGAKRRNTLEEMQKTAMERGGECLSKKYINSQTYLQWECHEGHIWNAKPNTIKNGSWCKECSVGLGERICREFFEKIFKKKFFRTKPNWLLNERGGKMELDGYCDSLKLAFEHQGDQHFIVKDIFIKNEASLALRQKDDVLKEKLCKENGVNLIVVPEIPKRLSIGNVKEYIIKECSRNGVKISENINNVEISLKKIYTSQSREIFDRLKRIALERGGRCLSNVYLGSAVKMKWECSVGHVWETSASKILAGHWCRKCAAKSRGEKRRGTIEEMQKIAKERGGECLSKTYINSNTLLTFRCAEGDVWKATPSTIKNGSWCKRCGHIRGGLKLRKTIEDMQLLAAKRGGSCLSQEYKTNKTPLEWQCKNKHKKWFARPNDIISSKSWCPECNNISKKLRNIKYDK